MGVIERAFNEVLHGVVKFGMILVILFILAVMLVSCVLIEVMKTQ